MINVSLICRTSHGLQEIGLLTMQGTLLTQIPQPILAIL